MCLENVEKDHCFGIVTGKRTFYMFSEDAGTTRQWIQKITASIKDFKEAAARRSKLGPAGSRPKSSATRDDEDVALEAIRAMEVSMGAGASGTPGVGGAKRKQESQLAKFVSDQGPGLTHSHLREFKALRTQKSDNMDLERLKTRVHRLVFEDRSK